MTDLTMDGRRASAFASIALGGMLAWSGSVSAQTAPPANEKPWAGCELSPETVASLAADMEDGNPNKNVPKIDADAVAIDAVIVLRLDTSNWGQPLFFNNGDPAGVTARILCAPAGMVSDDSEAARFPETGEVNILNADETLAIRAEGAGGNVARLCLTSNTTASDTDLEVDPVTCFRLVLE